MTDQSAVTFGPEERPYRNTLDDRLRAIEQLLSLPGGKIDDLTSRPARRVIQDARAALTRAASDRAALDRVREVAVMGMISAHARGDDERALADIIIVLDAALRDEPDASAGRSDWVDDAAPLPRPDGSSDA